MISAAVPFFALPILTRFLSPDAFGTAVLYMIAVTILVPTVGLSLHGAVSVRYFQKSQEDLPRFIGSVACLVGSFALIAALIALLIGSYLKEQLHMDRFWLSLAALAAGMQTLLNMQLALLQAKGQARAYGTLQVAQSILVNGSTVFLIVAVSMQWEARPVGHVLSLSLLTLFSLRAMYKAEYLAIPGRDAARHIREALKFGLPLVPHALSAIAIATVGQLMVNFNFGTSEVGVYALAFQLGSAYGLLADAFVKSYGPWLYRKLAERTEESRLQVVGSTYFAFCFFPVASILFYGFLMVIFDVIVGSQYAASKTLLPYFVLSGAFLGMYFAVANLFFFSSKTIFIPLVTVTSGVLGLLLMHALGRVIGIRGYAIGYLVAQMATFFLAWIISMKIYPLPWRRVGGSMVAFVRLLK